MTKLKPLSAALLLSGCAAMALSMTARAAGESETLRIPGLHKKAEILVDKWGVPHIYAASQTDAFFVQGFNAAREEFQILQTRHAQLGRTD